MNFGEKLTSLRKQKGLSQEELGEALNVTRQTISKWELDQTSPDSSKLIEIAKFFNIGVNELTSEEEIKIENTNEFTTSEGQKKSAGIIVLIIVLIICLVGIVFYATKLIIGKSISNIGKGIFNKSEQLQNESKNIFTNIVTGAIKEGNNSYNEFEEEFNKDSFNSSLELYVGTEGGSSVGYLLDKVVTSNKKTVQK